MRGRVPPTCPKDRFWDASKSDEKLVRGDDSVTFINTEYRFRSC